MLTVTNENMNSKEWQYERHKQKNEQ